MYNLTITFTCTFTRVIMVLLLWFVSPGWPVFKPGLNRVVCPVGSCPRLALLGRHFGQTAAWGWCWAAMEPQSQKGLWVLIPSRQPRAAGQWCGSSRAKHQLVQSVFCMSTSREPSWRFIPRFLSRAFVPTICGELDVTSGLPGNFIINWIQIVYAF